MLLFYNSSKVFVELSVVLVSFQVFTLDQAFDSLLDHLYVGDELVREDFGCLSDQVVVAQSLAGLHHFHDSGFDHVLSVVFNLLLHVGVLSLLLDLGQHHRNFDLNHVVVVLKVDSKLVTHGELLSLGAFV